MKIINLVSCGHRFGRPVGVSTIIDVSELPNPTRLEPERWRSSGGFCGSMIDWAKERDDYRGIAASIAGLAVRLAELDPNVRIALACKSGRHRSPVMARLVRDRLLSRGVETTINDRDGWRERTENRSTP